MVGWSVGRFVGFGWLVVVGWLVGWSVVLTAVDVETGMCMAGWLVGWLLLVGCCWLVVVGWLFGWRVGGGWVGGCWWWVVGCGLVVTW